MQRRMSADSAMSSSASSSSHPASSRRSSTASITPGKQEAVASQSSTSASSSSSQDGNVGGGSEAITSGSGGGVGLEGRGAIPVDSHRFFVNAEQQILAEIQFNRDRAAQLKTTEEEYLRLREKLKTLADKVSYPIMVPIGPLAFMPGHLVHTNEVTVGIGKNYFVECSTKQAVEILDRKLQRLEEDKTAVDESFETLRSRLVLAEEWRKRSEEVGKYVDIREDYTDEDEAKDKDRHPVGAARSPQQTSDDADEEERMRRLMELLALEEQEEREEQLSREERGRRKADRKGKGKGTGKETEQEGKETKRGGMKRTAKFGSVLDNPKHVRFSVPSPEVQRHSSTQEQAAVPPRSPSPLATSSTPLAFTGSVVERDVVSFDNSDSESAELIVQSASTQPEEDQTSMRPTADASTPSTSVAAAVPLGTTDNAAFTGLIVERSPEDDATPAVVEATAPKKVSRFLAARSLGSGSNTNK